MATGRKWSCNSCSSDKPAASLFRALESLAKANGPKCNCGTPYTLELEPAFGLSARRGAFIVVDCFLPNAPASPWENEKKGSVRFFPFLVILERKPADGARAVWLPYWHLVGAPGKQTQKYGQWAPFMDIGLYQSLLKQARQRGHLLP